MEPPTGKPSLRDWCFTFEIGVRTACCPQYILIYYEKKSTGKPVFTCLGSFRVYLRSFGIFNTFTMFDFRPLEDDATR